MRRLDLTPDERRERELVQNRERNRRYYEKHRLKIREERTSPDWRQYVRSYYQRNALHINQQNAARCDPEQKRLENARYRQRMGAALRAKKREDYQRNKKRYAATFSRAYERNKAERKAYIKAWQQANPEARFAHYAKRRAAKLTKGRVEKIVRLDILNRDKGICGLCGRPVDPMEFTLDHITPLSRGGAHTTDNLQVAHRSCNSRKHARTMAEFAAIV